MGRRLSATAAANWLQRNFPSLKSPLYVNFCFLRVAFRRQLLSSSSSTPQRFALVGAVLAILIIPCPIKKTSLRNLLSSALFVISSVITPLA